MWKLISTLAVLTATLVGCGGSNEGSSPASGVGGATTTTTASISSSNGVVSLKEVAELNFTSQPILIGATVTVSKINDASLNEIALDQQIFLESNLTDQNTVKIEISSQPIAAVPALISAAEAIKRLSTDDAVTVYMYALAGAGEGFDTLEPLPAIVDEDAGTIAIEIPSFAFQPTAKGTFVALLKIGIGKAEDLVSTLAAEKSALSLQKFPSAPAIPIASLFPIRCPLPDLTCIETSRFNENRYLNGVSKPHYGVDFQAKNPTAIYVPAGGTPVGGSTIDKKGTGIALILQYPRFNINLFHLSSIDERLLLNGAINARSPPTANNQVVAHTGGTGGFDPHLHFEISFKNTPTCSKKDLKCKGLRGRVDPFPYIAYNVTLAETGNKTALRTGEKYNFKFSASDLLGIKVTSAVGNAQENDGSPFFSKNVAASDRRYDPTRKVCLNSSISNVIGFPTPDEKTTFNGTDGSYCAPWGSEIEATALVGTPNTTIYASYSANAAVSVAQDLLSNAVAAWDLTNTQLPPTDPPAAQLSLLCSSQAASLQDGNILVRSDCPGSTATDLTFSQSIALYAYFTNNSYDVRLPISVNVAGEKADLVLVCRIQLSSVGSSAFQLNCNPTVAELYPYSFGAGPKTGRRVSFTGIVKTGSSLGAVANSGIADFKAQYEVLPPGS